jgi:hypothetical protein
MRPLLLNLVPSRLWILLSFLAGMCLGLFFLREDWPSGYGSLSVSRDVGAAFGSAGRAGGG